MTVDTLLRSSAQEREEALKSEIISIGDTIRAGEHEKAASMLADLRRGWPDAPKMKAAEESWRIYLNARTHKGYRNRMLYDELIAFTESIVSDCPNINTVGYAIDYMSRMADSDDFVFSHCTGQDISKLTILRQRYMFREEWEKFEPLNQLKTFDTVIELTLEDTYLRRTADNPPERMLVIYRAVISFIESLRNLRPPDAVSSRTIDAWSSQLADLHLSAARESSKLGLTDDALADIEYVAELSETALSIDHEIDIGTGCSQLDRIVYHGKPQWMVYSDEETYFFYIYNYDLNWSFGIDPYIYTYQLKKENSGFESLYSDDRFIALYDRLEALKRSRPNTHPGEALADD